MEFYSWHHEHQADQVSQLQCIIQKAEQKKNRDAAHTKKYVIDKICDGLPSVLVQKMSHGRFMRLWECQQGEEVLQNVLHLQHTCCCLRWSNGGGTYICATCLDHGDKFLPSKFYNIVERGCSAFDISEILLLLLLLLHPVTMQHLIDHLAELLTFQREHQVASLVQYLWVVLLQ